MVGAISAAMRLKDTAHTLSSATSVLVLALTFGAAPASAQEQAADLTASPSTDPLPGRTVGLGAIVGDPTALDLKLRFDTMQAVQIRAGWSFADPYQDRVVLMTDYTLHFPILYKQTKNAGLLAPYLGVGGKVGFSERPNPVTVGVRVPLGLSFLVRELPLEVFVEVVPGVHVAPRVDALVDAGIGARVYL